MIRKRADIEPELIEHIEQVGNVEGFVVFRPLSPDDVREISRRLLMLGRVFEACWFLSRANDIARVLNETWRMGGGQPYNFWRL